MGTTDNNDDDAKYVLSAPYILYETVSRVAKVGDWDPGLWEFIYEYFMKNLEKAGYVCKKGDEDDKSGK